MENTKVMKVNPLPSRTWHWLRMNQSSVRVALPTQALLLSASGLGDGITLEADAAYEMPQTETGMGAEFDAAMKETPSFLLTAEEGVNAGEPVVLTCGCEAGAGAGRITIHAGQGAVLPVVVLLSEERSPVDTAALQVKIDAEEGAKVSFSLVTLLGECAQCLTDLGAVCAQDAKLSLTQLSLGARETFSGVGVRLVGDRSQVDYEMGCRVCPAQNVDINYVTRHIGRDTVSTMNAWGILEEKSRKLFRGTIDFPSGCSGSKGQEKEEILFLGDGQINQTVPLILCTEEDVEGDHGATIGRLDEDVLFYLGSRGVGREAAEELIAQARLDAVSSRIPDGTVRRRAEDFILSMSKGDWIDEEL